MAMLEEMTFWEKVAEFFRNLNYAKLFFIGSLVFLGIALILVIVSFVVQNESQKRFEKELLDPERFIRIITINAPHMEVETFPLNDIAHPVTQGLNAFYAGFPLGERKRLMSWVNDILNGNNELQYFQVTRYKKNTKTPTKSFFRIIRSDPTSGIIHLESYYIDSRFRARNNKKSLSTEAEFAETLKANGSASGMTFCFRLVEKNGNRFHVDSRGITPELAKKYCEFVSRFAIGNQKAIALSPGEVVIANFSFVDLSHALLFSLQAVDGISELMRSYMRESKQKKRFEVRCGIVSNRDLLGDSDRILKEASNTAIKASETPNPVVVYEKKAQTAYAPTFDESYENEVSRIIEEKRISYTFRPIFNAKHLKIYGYISRSAPMGTSFGSMDELKNYAMRTNAQKTLFSAIVKRTIPRFNNERQNKEQCLFFPLRMDERSCFVPFFQRYRSAKDTNLYLTFYENDMVNALDQPGIELFIKQMDDLKEKGYRVAIVLNGNTLGLDHSLYKMSDAFLVDLGRDDSAEIDTKIRSELHALVEGLLKYRKPIIATNLTSWNAIEIVVRSGIDYISSDVFAPYEKMMKPITEKNIERIRVMKEGD